jgi:signal transduction histidine kinase
VTAGRRFRRTTVAVVAAAVAVGASAEWTAYRGSGLHSWGPDLAVGWSLVLCGLALRRLTPRSRCGELVAAAGLAWFAGNFAAVDLPVVAWLAAHTTYLHRALLAHAVLAFPRGRLVPFVRWVVVAAVYVAALWPALATSDAAWIVLASAVLVAAIALGDRRAVPGAVAFALAVGGVAAAAVLRPLTDRDTLLVVYELGLVATALALVVVASLSASTVADRVVELGETASVRDALRRVLHDPSLELLFTRDGGYVDEHGRSVALPPVATRRVTVLGPSHAAVVVHDETVGVDGALADAVWCALRLTTENARLHADLLEQVLELRASRRRLVLARGRQRALLARRLREGALSHLIGIEATLSGVDPRGTAVGGAVAQARRLLREACDGIDALALGLQPRVLASSGLGEALGVLAEHSPVPVAVSVPGRRFDAALEHAAYLVCSEALANVSKHAGASHAAVRVGIRGGRLWLEIADDGCGGADPAGNGLRGLAERLEELRGTLRVESPPGTGTRIIAEIPLRTDRDLPGQSGSGPIPRQNPVAVGAAR